MIDERAANGQIPSGCGSSMSLPVPAHELFIRPDEQCVALTRDYRLIQRLKGHKYSVDDLLVAALAVERPIEPRRVLDLGCGLGSVLLMTAWVHRRARFVGIEAQDEHVVLAKRNITLNGCENRVRVHHADLRDLEFVESLGQFDLVTGTPPYFDPAAATVCADPQRAYAQWELRGGIEEYARAAGRVLSPDGLFVACASALIPERGPKAIAEAGLELVFRQNVLPKPGRDPFLQLLVASKISSSGSANVSDLLLRNEDGTRTEQHMAARRRFGLDASLW